MFWSWVIQPWRFCGWVCLVFFDLLLCCIHLSCVVSIWKYSLCFSWLSCLVLRWLVCPFRLGIVLLSLFCFHVVPCKRKAAFDHLISIYFNLWKMVDLLGSKLFVCFVVIFLVFLIRHTFHLCWHNSFLGSSLFCLCLIWEGLGIHFCLGWWDDRLLLWDVRVCHICCLLCLEGDVGWRGRILSFLLLFRRMLCVFILAFLGALNGLLFCPSLC